MLKNALMTGIIKSVNGEYATVEFPQYDNIVDINVLIPNALTTSDKSQFMKAANTPVLIAFDELGQAFIINSFFTETNERPFSSLNKFGYKFSDGTEISYDKDSKKVKISGSILTVEITSAVSLTVTSPLVTINGNLTVNGNVACGSIGASGTCDITGGMKAASLETTGGADLDTLKTAYNAHAHGGVQVGGGVSGGTTVPA